MATGKTKVTVELPDEAITELTAIAEIQMVNRTTALRQAVKTQIFLLREISKGNKVLILDEKTGQQREVVFL